MSVVSAPNALLARCTAAPRAGVRAARSTSVVRCDASKGAESNNPRASLGRRDVFGAVAAGVALLSSSQPASALQPGDIGYLKAQREAAANAPPAPDPEPEPAAAPAPADTPPSNEDTRAAASDDIGIVAAADIALNDDALSTFVQRHEPAEVAEALRVSSGCSAGAISSSAHDHTRTVPSCPPLNTTSRAVATPSPSPSPTRGGGARAVASESTAPRCASKTPCGCTT